MVSISTLGNSLGIVNAAANFLASDAGQKAIGKAGEVVGAGVRAATVGSALTAITRQTTIISRVFIDAGILDEIVLANLMKAFHEWYAAQVIAALGLQALVDDKRTVASMMQVIQTGDNARQHGVLDNIVKRSMGVESFLEAHLGQTGLESFRMADVGLEALSDKEVERLQSEHAKLKEQAAKHMGPQHLSTKDANALHGKNQQLQDEVDKFKAVNPSMTLRSVAASENKMGPMGELFEVTLTNPRDHKANIKVPVYIQMQPSIIPAQVAARFIDMNVSQSLWQRWTQMRAGEIGFWKDFIGQRDAIKRKKALLKDPKTAAAFSTFLNTVAKKDAYALADVSDRSASPMSHNLANSVIVLSADAVYQAKIDSQIDLYKTDDRKRYFRDTYTMILAIVDPLHQRVTIYFNGIEGELDCSYADFRPKDKHFDPTDFVKAISAFSTGSTPRMR